MAKEKEKETSEDLFLLFREIVKVECDVFVENSIIAIIERYGFDQRIYTKSLKALRRKLTREDSDLDTYGELMAYFSGIYKHKVLDSIQEDKQIMEIS